MERKNYKAFIVEGEDREIQIIENLRKVYFKHSNVTIISIPAGQNIYMLWKRMKVDEFATDIIEVLREDNEEIAKLLEGIGREDFAEVFLFFDYDGHQQNLAGEEREKDVIQEMLLDFDNETENGKLYISYPMSEALRDYLPGICGNEENCYCSLEDMSYYKRISADRAYMLEMRKYTYREWIDIMNVFVMRLSCLMNKNELLSFEQYRNEITPLEIYENQKKYIERMEVFILSAFPEFILDYFNYKFWRTTVAYTNWKRECI